MRPEVAVTEVQEAPPLPEKVTRKFACKYPFDKLDRAGLAFDVQNRHETSVKHGLKRWLASHPEAKSMWFTVRKVGNVVRVRRDK